MDETRVEAIRALAEPILAGQQTELVELICRPLGRNVLIRLLVDKVGGVTVQDCATMNRQIGDALDAARLIEESYTLEVSSPGLDRPLATKRDYERALGEELKLLLQAADGAVRETSGMLLAVQADAVVLKTLSGNVTIPMAEVRMAKKAVRWSRDARK